MKKKILVCLVLLASILGLAYSEANKSKDFYVREYVEAADVAVMAINTLVKGKEYNSYQMKRIEEAKAKMNDVNYHLVEFADKLTQEDMNKINRANSKLLDASAKLQTWIQQNGY